MRLDRIVPLLACIGLLAGAAILATRHFEAQASGGGSLRCGAPWHDGLTKIDTEYQYSLVDDPEHTFTGQICVDGARRRLAVSSLLGLAGLAFAVIGVRRRTEPPGRIELTG